MQYTSNYNLMLPEGNDTVNLLTQMNPNTSDIDAAMFANKQMGVGRASESTTGTVHAITRANQDSPIFAFTATSNWTKNDTMSVDGVACSVYLTDGTQPDSNAYVINSEVLAIVQGSRVTIFVQQSIDASMVSYDNTTSGLTATNIQSAIDELDSNVEDLIISTETIETVNITTGNVDFTPTQPTVAGYKIVALSSAYLSTSADAIVKGVYRQGTSWAGRIYNADPIAFTGSVICEWLLIKQI